MSGFRRDPWLRIREHSDISRRFLLGRLVQHLENKRRRVKYLFDRVSQIGQNANFDLCFDKVGHKLSYKLSQRLSFLDISDPKCLYGFYGICLKIEGFFF